MIVIDIPRTPSGDEFVRVGIIGSCRVRDMFFEAYQLDPKPPESIGAPECKTVWYRFSTFTHTPSQALQYFNFVTGELDIPEVLQASVFSKNITPEIEKRVGTLTPEIIDSIDLFVGEVSTLKEFSVEQFHINISYAEVALVRAGGKPLLKWWRSVSDPKDTHDAIVQETLDALPSKDIPNTEEMARVIKSARCHVLSQDELETSIKELQAKLGKPLLVVPGFDVPDQPIKDRSDLIDMLYDLSPKLGYHFYDPTIVVAAAGREKAVKGTGTAPCHYNHGFHYTLLKSIVPFLQDALDEHEETGLFKSTKYVHSSASSQSENKAA